MAIRNLSHWDDPIFRKKSKVVEKFDQRLWDLLDDMRDMLTKVGGYGCAAVHVGVLRRVVVVNDDNCVIELVNPVILESSSETQEVMEGSISPGAPRCKVIRPKSVKVSALDRNGSPITVTGDGFLLLRFFTRFTILMGFCLLIKRMRGLGIWIIKYSSYLNLMKFK